MMGLKARVFQPMVNVSLEDLVPATISIATSSVRWT